MIYWGKKEGLCATTGQRYEDMNYAIFQIGLRYEMTN